MIPRIIELGGPLQAAEEMRSVGCDPAGAKIMSPKTISRLIKLKDIKPAAANIIKQEMLSFGGEAVTAYGAINHSVKKTDVIVIGTMRQLLLLIKKLKLHQFGLPQISNEIEASLANFTRVPPPLKVGPMTLDFGLRTYIMGILNVTPDSFSDGGNFFNLEEAVRQAEKMAAEGADIIDVGGESSRPGAKSISAGEEIRRVIPVIRRLAKNKKMAISIDTRKAEVARAALKAGAHMVNDISGLRHDKKMARVIAQFKAPVCIMHMRGTPATMQKKPAYLDLMGELCAYFEESIAIANNAGILHGKILVDPGIGFGKTVAHNLEIIRKLKELRVLGLPVLIGPSRKSFIGKVLGLPAPERLEGTAAAVAAAIQNGANLVRVHDVKAISRVVRMADAIVRRS